MYNITLYYIVIDKCNDVYFYFNNYSMFQKKNFCSPASENAKERQFV